MERVPVQKLKEYVIQSFNDCGKRHLFITGSKGIGKSTLLKSLLEKEKSFGGIITRAVIDGGFAPGHIVLHDIWNDSINGIAGHRNEDDSGMIPCIEVFEKVGVSILRRYRESSTPLIIIDEIGFLENKAYCYQNEIMRCMKEKRIIAVLRKMNTPFLNEIRNTGSGLLIDLDEINMK